MIDDGLAIVWLFIFVILVVLHYAGKGETR